MQIIKNKQLTDHDGWSFIADDATIPDNGDITIGLQRWQNAKAERAQRNGRTGLRLLPGDDVAVLAGQTDGMALIELSFPSFGDGRPFSQARLLRSMLAYQGEIRAVGNFLPDQVYYLLRVGVDAFQIEDPAQAELALAGLQDFSVNYQPSSVNI